ncbi:hypothetical protein C9J03_14205 [Photobacterium gaetbulicola]|nr:hypothetical protein C9J03_14205 [Photobacterium gaetbulicola]
MQRISSSQIGVKWCQARARWLFCKKMDFPWLFLQISMKSTGGRYGLFLVVVMLKKCEWELFCELNQNLWLKLKKCRELGEPS